MGKINILGFDVANLIAAGEVVDRPSSAVKELIENSLDAGAKNITAEIKNGGSSFIRVTDDGCGIEPDDMPKAVLRHATSKIADASDLEAIMTLGFRGEALAAIASVSKMRIISKTHGASFGSELTVEAGEAVSQTETGCADGTTIIAEELFYNVPARRKFLKKDANEAASVLGVVEKLALSEPDVSFRLIVDGALRLVTPGDGKLESAVYAVMGRDIARACIGVDRAEGALRVSGVITTPSLQRGNRAFENFYINNRFVKSKTMAAALEQAYLSYLPAERFPFCALNLTMPAGAVDVNVHPAKLEVKFSDEKLVFDAVYYAVRSALENMQRRPEVKFVPQKERERVSDASSPVRDRTYGSTAAASDPRKLQFRIGAQTYDINRTPPASRDNNRDALPLRSNDALLPRADKTPPSAVAHDVPPAQRTQGIPPAAADYMPPLPTANDLPPVAKDMPPSGSHDIPPVPDAVDAPPLPDTRDIPPPDADATQPAAHNETAPPTAAPNKSSAAAPDGNDAARTVEYKLIGEAWNSYVIVETADRLLLIDKHAAHERIIFEDLRKKNKAALDTGANASQLLIAPVPVRLTAAEAAAVVSYAADIRATGFDWFTLDADGGRTFCVTAIPDGVPVDAAEAMFCEFGEQLSAGTGSAALTRSEFFEGALYQVACKAAIKAGRVYDQELLRYIVDRLLSLPDIKYCPHGRPVAIELTRTALERQFARLK